MTDKKIPKFYDDVLGIPEVDQRLLKRAYNSSQEWNNFNWGEGVGIAIMKEAEWVETKELVDHKDDRIKAHYTLTVAGRKVAGRIYAAEYYCEHWEYINLKRIEVQPDVFKAYEDYSDYTPIRVYRATLEELGRHGWELIQLVDRETYGYFKRRVIGKN